MRPRSFKFRQPENCDAGVRRERERERERERKRERCRSLRSVHGLELGGEYSPPSFSSPLLPLMSIILVRVDLAASAKEPEFVDGAGGASAPAIRPPLACAAVSSASPPRSSAGRFLGNSPCGIVKPVGWRPVFEVLAANKRSCLSRNESRALLPPPSPPPPAPADCTGDRRMRPLRPPAEAAAGAPISPLPPAPSRRAGASS